MYRILLYIVCIMTFQNLCADNNLKIKLSSGDIVDSNYLFLEKDNPIFYTENNDGLSFEFALIDQDKNSGELKRILLEKTEYIKEIQFYPSKYKTEFNATKYHESVDHTHNAHIVELKITNKENKTTTYLLHFLLIPSKPLVNGSYFGDWSSDLVDFESKIHLRLFIETDNASSISIERSGEWFFRSEYPLTKRFFSDYEQFTQSRNKKKLIL